MQVFIQRFDISYGPIHLSCLHLTLQGLQMMMKVMLIAPHFLMDAAYFLQVAFCLFLLDLYQLYIGSF